MEIKFIALPSVKDVRRMAEREEITPQVQRRLQAFENASWLVMRAQRKAATVACEFVRPNEFKQHKAVYRELVRDAREKFEQACVDSFSETCTRGLD